MAIYHPPLYRQLFFGAIAAFSIQVTSVSADTFDPLRIGVEADVPPFESRNEKGELIGLNIEIGNAVCAQMNVKCEWVDQPYSGNITALKAKRFDVIMPMAPTDFRRQQIDFSDVMYPTSSQLVARKGTVLQPTTISLEGKRVGVLRGTSREAFAQARWATAGIQLEPFGTNHELIESLLAGKIDATLQDSIEISEALLNKPEGQPFGFIGPTLTDPLLGTGVAMGVRKEDVELRNRLNLALTALKENGVYQNILTRYLPKIPDAGSSVSSLNYLGENVGKPFSEAVRADNVLYLSGVLGDDENGKLAKDTAGQTVVIMDKIKNTLEKNDSSLEHVIQCNVILANIKDFAAMNQVYTRYFTPGRLPARTTFEASKLVADARIEIDCRAAIKS